jgi:hypothetical protein
MVCSREENMEQIFCDETGFTGPDLLNPDQKYFGYASVRIDSQEATELVDRVRAEHPLQMPEWKGSKMLKTRRGREAALAVFEAVQDRSITTVVDKRFALSGKLFEYIFEPAIVPFSGDDVVLVGRPLRSRSSMKASAGGCVRASIVGTRLLSGLRLATEVELDKAFRLVSPLNIRDGNPNFIEFTKHYVCERNK